jgi:WXG100 family type VII secretion target
MPNVNVSYEEMRSAAGRLKAGQEEITQKLNELQRQVNSLVNGGYVTDSSSKQFEAAYSQFTSGASKAVQGLHDMGEYLTKAAETFQNADQDLSARLHH